MASTLGYLGAQIISASPIPAAAIPRLRLEFGDHLAGNRNLDTASRLTWLTEVRNVPAADAAQLCEHEFTVEQLKAILDVEKRRGPLLALLKGHRHSAEALRAIVEHRNGAGVAEELVGDAEYPQEDLLVHIEKMKPAKKAKLLAALPPAVLGDDVLVGHLQHIEDGLTDGRRGGVSRLCAEMITLRPRLGSKLLAAEAPQISCTALGGSPWLTEPDVELLFNRLLTVSDGTRKFTEMALAGNPWVDPDGCIKSRLTFGDSREILHRRSRKDVRHVVGDPAEISGDALMSAVWRALPSQYKARGRPELLLLIARNPHLEGRWLERVGYQVMELAQSSYPPPLWALAETEAAFTSNHPDDAFIVKGAGDPPERTPTHRQYGDRDPDPVDPEQLERVYTRTSLRALTFSSPVGVAALARFAAELGDDPATWTAAALLADGVDVTLSELAELAAATS